MIPLNLPQKNYITAFWKLDEESGTRYDETDNDNDLTDNNTVTYDTGKISNAAKFTKANSEYLSIADGSQTGLDLTVDWTICCWVKSNNAGDYEGIVSKYGVNPNCAYMMRVMNTNKLQAYCSDDGNPSGINVATSTTSLTRDGSTWEHCCMRHDSSDVGHEVQIVLNGVEEDDANVTDVPDTSSAFEIGRYPGEYVNGLIDEVIIWNGACLSDEEVAQVMNITSYSYGGGASLLMLLSEAFKKHDRLWTPKLILPKEGYSY